MRRPGFDRRSVDEIGLHLLDAFIRLVGPVRQVYTRLSLREKKGSETF